MFLSPVKMYFVYNLLFTIGFMGCMCNSSSSASTSDNNNSSDDDGVGGLTAPPSSDDSMDTKYKSWEPNSNSFSSDDIRCYCNFPRCVSTGYMCRTAASTANGGCFSELTADASDISTTRHGCIELLRNENNDFQCSNSNNNNNNNNRALRKNNRQPDLTNVNRYKMQVHCCHEDMCNHVDRPDHKRIRSNNTNNGVDQDFFINSRLPYDPDYRSEKQSLYPMGSAPPTDNEVWFKIVTIAVPICGAVILFVLVALAIRLLKTEAIESPSKLNGSGHNGGIGGVGGGGGVGIGNGSGIGNSSSSTRKIALDFEAYGTHGDHIHASKQMPLLHKHHTTSSEYFNNHCIAHSELKNECLAKKNQIMSLEYSLLPQSCHDGNKQTNTEVGILCENRNVNECINKNGCDSKVYEKEILNSTPYWAGN